MTRDTRELDFAHHRQLFLTEQGYSYQILDEAEVCPPPAMRRNRMNDPDPEDSLRRQAAPPGCLVLTEDAVLAEELLARKKLAQDIVGRLSDTALLIRPGRVEAVVEELRRMGHTPQVVGR